MIRSAFAPAKVNLFLHVGALDPSGYHPVVSLAAFADVGDKVSLAPSESFEFVVEGPFAPILRDEADNLVVRALRELQRVTGLTFSPMRLMLHKTLPVAGGVGGGSSDAGAVLRLLRAAFELDVADEVLAQVAATMGADGPLCLFGVPSIAQGRGDELSPAPGLPELHAVLVNPLRPCPTGRVYAAFDAAASAHPPELPRLPEAFESAAELAAILAMTRNDLERPAILLEPAIGQVLARLHGDPQVLLARMSGSGATCFALTTGEMEAASLAAAISAERGDWWVAPCRLGGPWPDC